MEDLDTAGAGPVPLQYGVDTSSTHAGYQCRAEGLTCPLSSPCSHALCDSRPPLLPMNRALLSCNPHTVQVTCLAFTPVVADIQIVISSV